MRMATSWWRGLERHEAAHAGAQGPVWAQRRLPPPLQLTGSRSIPFKPLSSRCSILRASTCWGRSGPWRPRPPQPTRATWTSPGGRPSAAAAGLGKRGRCPRGRRRCGPRPGRRTTNVLLNRSGEPSAPRRALVEAGSKKGLDRSIQHAAWIDKRQIERRGRPSTADRACRGRRRKTRCG